MTFSRCVNPVISAVLIVTVLALGGVLAVMNLHAVPQWRLSRVESGMTKNDVARLVGVPTSSSSTGRTWTYSTMTWCIVRIRFSPGGVVESVEHDH
jgi:outer membrane protein assembly factor BamE (lipoprotein component of BamABCDE complex)